MNGPLIALDARSIGRDQTGDTTYWTGLVHGLCQIDTDLRFLLFSNAPKPAEIPEHSRISWVQVPSRRERWWSLFKFPLTARRMGANVIHTQYNLSPLAGKGGITTIHDVSFYIGPDWFKPKDRLLLQRFVPASARRAAKVITVSEASKKDIVRFIPEAAEKTVVTHLAVKPGFGPMDPREARECVEYDFGLTGMFMLTVGTRWPRKNMSLAVEAAEKLPSTLPHQLVITGKAGWGDEAALDRTLYVGYVDEKQLRALYTAADLYLAPSRYEGFGLTLLEAFTCGCPVLCSGIPAHLEVAGSAAECAASFQQMDWSAQIQKLLGDSSKLEEMRQAGRDRAARFSWKDTAQKTEQVYQEVLNG